MSDLGKYAVYVWPAYAITATVLLGMIWASLSRARRWRRETERLEKVVGPRK